MTLAERIAALVEGDAVEHGTPGAWTFAALDPITGEVIQEATFRADYFASPDGCHSSPCHRNDGLNPTSFKIAEGEARIELAQQRAGASRVPA